MKYYQHLSSLVFTILSICFVAPWLAGQVAAAGLSSDWVKTPYTQSRLMVGGYDPATQKLHLGWHVLLAKGWKTYWRSPGEAGMPPRWNWHETKNLRQISVKWPVPERLNFYGYDTFVYHDEVILPVEVDLKDPTAATQLSLALDYMVCKDICVPLNGEYHLDLPPAADMSFSPYQRALLQKYRARLPEQLPAGRVRVVDQGNGRLHIRGNLAKLVSGPIRDLYVEAPEGYSFSRPERTDEAVLSDPDGSLDLRIGYEKQKHAPTLSGQDIILTFVTETGHGHEIRATVSSP